MCTFEQIQEANKSIKTMPISRKDKKTGEIITKDYAEVPQRIKVFRMLYPTGTIETEMVSNDGAICVFKAIIRDDSGKVLATGTAFEKADSSFINQTSYIENCETSAVGRALGFCGIGIDTSIASYEEVANAMNNQKTQDIKKETKKPVAVEEAELKAQVLGYFNRRKMGMDKLRAICTHYRIKNINELNADQCRDYIKQLNEKGININE